jgi:phosphoribosylanthranilate isomerase
MSVRVKICGLMRPEDTEAAIVAGADFLGVVFADSRRQQTIESARDILSSLPDRAGLPFYLTVTEGYPAEEWYYQAASRIERVLDERPLVVGVFEGQDSAAINKVSAEVGLDMAQVGAADPWELFGELDRHTIKTVRGGSASFGEMRVGPYLCLLDSECSGSGTSFPWERAARVARNMPVMLAGGLTPDNVHRAIETVRPWAVDVSSGIETNGQKDPIKIRDFVQAAKAVEL